MAASPVAVAALSTGDAALALHLAVKRPGYCRKVPSVAMILFLAPDTSGGIG
jgi:hypothetical protein